MNKNYHANLEKRCLSIASFMLENQCTVRQAANHFKISKSCVHYGLTTLLKDLDVTLFTKVQLLLAHNKQEAPKRGGHALKQKRQEQNS